MTVTGASQDHTAAGNGESLTLCQEHCWDVLACSCIPAAGMLGPDNALHLHSVHIHSTYIKLTACPILCNTAYTANTALLTRRFEHTS